MTRDHYTDVQYGDLVTSAIGICRAAIDASMEIDDSRGTTIFLLAHALGIALMTATEGDRDKALMALTEMIAPTTARLLSTGKMVKSL
jgi:hypothetical protein